MYEQTTVMRSETAMFAVETRAVVVSHDMKEEDNVDGIEPAASQTGQREEHSNEPTCWKDSLFTLYLLPGLQKMAEDHKPGIGNDPILNADLFLTVSSYHV